MIEKLNQKETDPFSFNHWEVVRKIDEIIDYINSKEEKNKQISNFLEKHRRRNK